MCFFFSHSREKIRIPASEARRASAQINDGETARKGKGGGVGGLQLFSASTQKAITHNVKRCLPVRALGCGMPVNVPPFDAHGRSRRRRRDGGNVLGGFFWGVCFWFRVRVLQRAPVDCIRETDRKTLVLSVIGPEGPGPHNASLSSLRRRGAAALEGGRNTNAAAHFSCTLGKGFQPLDICVRAHTHTYICVCVQKR